MTPKSERRTLHGDTSGVCYNCLNGGHGICEGNGCRCALSNHSPWWWKTEEEMEVVNKAIELVSKFHKTMTGPGLEANKRNAPHIAIVCINEIIAEHHRTINSKESRDRIAFWLEVFKDINNL